MIWLYGEATVAPGSEIVIIDGGTKDGMTTTVSVPEVALTGPANELSVTLTVKVNVPATDGMPDRIPVLPNVRPVGKDPEFSA